jgi:NADH-quinone oxidoreductase subunit F
VRNHLKENLHVEDLLLSDLSHIVPLDFDRYVAQEGYTALTRVFSLGMRPADLLEEIKASGLRGRGGAGFPTGQKWEFVAKKTADRKYLCCNGAEDEPGTFKDRYLLRRNPHQLIEGVILASYTIGAQEAYLYINGTFHEELRVLETALQRAHEAGYWGERILGSSYSLEIRIAKSPGTYIAGEETALLEVIEGRVAAPRQKPPYYPAVHGLYGKPTVVNNVETLFNIPDIVRRGSKWFSNIGAKASPGTMIFTLTGDVKRPGLYERPLGALTVRELIEQCGGGVNRGGRLKAVYPGGPSNNLIPSSKADVLLDFDSLKAIGSGLGTGAVIVMGEETCMVERSLHYSSFFMRESCGQCPPCKLGTAHLSEILGRIESGEGSEKDVQQVGQVCGMIKGRGYCYFLTGAALAVESIFKNFQEEYLAHVRERRCIFK